MNEQTAVQGICIEVEGVTLNVVDVRKPLWYGDYYGGKLAIYNATAEPSIISDCTSVLIVYTNMQGLDNVMTAHYEFNVPIEDIVSHIQTHTIIAYHKIKAESHAIPVAPPNLLQ